MPLGRCCLCFNVGLLCNSHALPDAFFKSISRKNSGKGIVVTDDATTPIAYSSDSWHARMLCANCEALLNKRYDEYGIAVFQGRKGSVHTDGSGITLLGIDCRRIRMFLLSLVWRISISSHDNYSNINLSYSLDEELRCALFSGQATPANRFTTKLSKLCDSTKPGGFGAAALRDFVAAPFAREYVGHNLISVCFIFFGFFVEVFIPYLPKSPGSSFRTLTNGTVHSAPYLEIFDVPEITDLMGTALKKLEQGLSRVR